MMDLQGKGFFTWRIPKCEQGDPRKIVSLAVEAGLTHLVLKVADGPGVYNGNWGDAKDHTSPVIMELRNKGIKVYGWHYVYGNEPSSESTVAIRRIKQLRVA